MKTPHRGIAWIVVATVTLALAAVVVVADTPMKLPDVLAFPQGEDSPGVVKFDHLTHVDPAQPDCTTCHPALFKILKREIPGPDGPAFHAEMENGRHCGKCHDGNAAFAIDDCLACHQEE